MKYSFKCDTRLGEYWITEEDGFIIGFSNNKYIPGDVIEETPLIKETVKQVTEYFAGKRIYFDLPLRPHGTPFQQKVWAALQEIPYGETRTYKQIAGITGDNKACRAVGMANNRNPIGIIIPCHRVVGSDGKLVGYAGGLDKKLWLLRHEKEHIPGKLI